METWNAVPQTSRRKWLVAITLSLLLPIGACTLLVDRTATQCQSDTDCAKFGNHPYCQGGVCVSSGLQPANCFYGTPTQPQDFLNQCSVAECLSFDNCSRLGLCDGGDMPALMTPDDAGVGMQTSTSAPVAVDGGDAAPAPVMPSCFDPTNGRSQVVYITGSSNFPPLMAKLAPLVLANQVTPVFQVTSSCTAVKDVFGGTVIVDPKPGPGAKYAAYYNSDGSSVPCLLGANGVPVDIGESDIFSSTCNVDPSPSAGEYLGPIQAMIFVVPSISGQTAITAEAARAVFGVGGDDGMATPWINPDLYFVRNANTGTQQMIGHAIGVPAEGFWGIDRGTAASVDSLLRVISDPALAEQAIGIISSDYYDGDRGNLKALAFKATGQGCAYLPDSTESKKDKFNVRDGHYPIWGPLHFFTPVADGVPLSAGAQTFVSIVSVPNIPKQLLDAFIASSLVPSCAMNVQRATELGPLSQYTAPYQCGCYFEASLNGSPPAGCNRCSTANDCGDPARPACNLGFCEVQ
jgi:ABC-type phosphate transport system substrate-binding protein